VVLLLPHHITAGAALLLPHLITAGAALLPHLIPAGAGGTLHIDGTPCRITTYRRLPPRLKLRLCQQRKPRRATSGVALGAGAILRLPLNHAGIPCQKTTFSSSLRRSWWHLQSLQRFSQQLRAGVGIVLETGVAGAAGAAVTQVVGAAATQVVGAAGTILVVVMVLEVGAAGALVVMAEAAVLAVLAEAVVMAEAALAEAALAEAVPAEAVPAEAVLAEAVLVEAVDMAEAVLAALAEAVVMAEAVLAEAVLAEAVVAAAEEAVVMVVVATKHGSRKDEIHDNGLANLFVEHVRHRHTERGLQCSAHRCRPARTFTLQFLLSRLCVVELSPPGSSHLASAPQSVWSIFYDSCPVGSRAQSASASDSCTQQVVEYFFLSLCPREADEPNSSRAMCKGLNFFRSSKKAFTCASTALSLSPAWVTKSRRRNGSD